VLLVDAAMEVFRDLPSSTALSAFCKQDESNREFSDELRSILEVSAMTGLYWHNWDELCTLLLFRLKQVLQEYYKSHIDVAVGPPRPLVTGESYQELEDRLTTGLKSFTDGAPFTLQRLCEILLNPRDRYPNLDKVALAFEKLLLVTSTIPPSAGPYPGTSSVPAPTPEPAVAKEADSKPTESPRRENADSNSEITSTSSDGPVEAEIKGPVAAVAADEEMVDTVSTESKEEPMEVDGPQPSGTVAAEDDGTKENVPEVPAVTDEWHLVDAADISASAPPETNQESAAMVDRNDSEGGVAASRL
jgi:serine/threonine-protein phosphatase 4 regulatory subunit 2